MTGSRTETRADAIADMKTEYRRVKVGGRFYNIPVDEDGFVPREDLARRFLNTSEGSRRGNRRNPIIDHSSKAKITYEGDRFRPDDIKFWWAHPNESDVENIDTPGADLFNVSKYSRKSTVNSQKRIAIVDATPDQSLNIRKTLDACFTKKELDTIAKDEGLTIILDDSILSAGSYEIKNRVIRLKPGIGMERSTIVHEVVHHLKTKDYKRSGMVTKTHTLKSTPEEKNLEEAATEAESVARLSPWKGRRNPGYYGTIRGSGMTPDEMIEKDRRLFVGNSKNGGQGLRGIRAVNSVENNFDKSEISKLKYHGSVQAGAYVKKLKKT